MRKTHKRRDTKVAVTGRMLKLSTDQGNEDNDPGKGWRMLEKQTQAKRGSVKSLYQQRNHKQSQQQSSSCFSWWTSYSKDFLCCLKLIYFFIYEVQLCILNTHRKCSENLKTHTKSCHAGNRNFVCARASAGTQTHSFTPILQLFNKRTVPPKSPQSEKIKEEGCNSTVTDRPCSSAPASETTSTDIKVCFPAGPVQSLPSSVGASPQ